MPEYRIDSNGNAIVVDDNIGKGSQRHSSKGKWITLFFVIIAVVLFFLIRNNSSSNSIACVGIGNNSIFVAQGETARASFTAESSGTYIFTTTGNNDTYGSLLSTAMDSNAIETDDDSGIDHNFKIEYSLRSNQTVFIGVKFYNANTSGNINLNITRKMDSTTQTTFVTGNSQIAVLVIQPVTNLHEKGRFINSVILSWNRVDNASGYEVAYRQFNTGEWIIAYNHISGITATINGLDENTNYQFRVTALCGSQRSDGSVVNISTKSATPMPMITKTPVKKRIANTVSPKGANPVDMVIPVLKSQNYSISYSRIFTNAKNSSYDMNIDIYWVQVQLKELGYYHNDLSGLFDSQTNNAIQSFMNSQGMPYSNIITQEVINTIYDVIGSRRIPVMCGGYYHALNGMSIIWSNLNEERYGIRQKYEAHKFEGAKAVQTCLKALGYYTSTIDKMFGEGTDRAVQQFERDNGFIQKSKGHVFVSYGEARKMLELYVARGYKVQDLEFENGD